MRACQAVFLVLSVFVPAPTWGFQPTVEPTSSSRYQRFISELFEKFDQNGDGAIQKSEYANVHYPLLNHADQNRDGKVTPEEVLSWVAPNVDFSDAANLDGEAQTTPIQHNANRIAQMQKANPVIRMSQMGAIGNLASPLENHASVSKKTSPKTADISFVALQLPVDLAQHEVVSLVELKEVFASKSVDKLNFEDKGIRLLDLCEFSVVDRIASKLTFGKTKTVEQHLSRSQTQLTKMGLGSKISMTPHFHDGFVELDLDYSSTAINENDRGVRQLDTQTKLVFKEKQKSKLVNLYNEGAHYLLIVSVKSEIK